MELHLLLTHRYDTSSDMEANWRLNRELMTANTQLSVHRWKYWYCTVQEPYLRYLSVSKAPAGKQLQQIICLPSGLDTHWHTHTHTNPHIAQWLQISIRQKIDVCPDFILSSCTECSTVVIELGVVGTKIKYSSSVDMYCMSWDAWHYVSWFWMDRQTQMVFQGLYGGWLL